MKRKLTRAIALIMVLSMMVLPVSAAEVTTDPVEAAEVTAETLAERKMSFRQMKRQLSNFLMLM
ncbi:MAG: hypothetical protein V8S08_05600 [Lachnoclostridium sp.]